MPKKRLPVICSLQTDQKGHPQQNMPRCSNMNSRLTFNQKVVCNFLANLEIKQIKRDTMFVSLCFQGNGRVYKLDMTRFCDCLVYFLKMLLVPFDMCHVGSTLLGRGQKQNHIKTCFLPELLHQPNMNACFWCILANPRMYSKFKQTNISGRIMISHESTICTFQAVIVERVVSV